jgi:hypothetical protein|tara:strand:- start:272 stop:457 length:186 start_codon:yes stop_codon:yes gene_type:complete
MHNPKATKSQLNAYIALQDTLILSLQTEVMNNKSLLIETIIAIQRSAVRYAEEEMKKYNGY